MRHRSLIVATATIAAMLAGPIAAGAAGTASSDQDRAEAAIAAFVSDVESAGFESSGPANDEDILDLVPPQDASKEDIAAYGCFDDMAALLADDGTFIGETARALSDDYDYVVDGAPSTTDIVSFGADDNSISAGAVFVDLAHADALGTIVEAFGSAKVRDCLHDELTADLGTDDSAGAIEMTNSNDLGIGDQSAEFSFRFSFSFADETSTFDTTLVLARVDRALAIVISSTSGKAGVLTAQDALVTIVDSLGK